MEEIISLEQLAVRACESFKAVFGQEPDVGAFAPGRVNLLGEHSGNDEGFAFSMALPLVTVIVGRKSDTDVCKIVTLCPDVDDPKEIEIPLSSLAELAPGKPKWANCVKVVLNMHPRRADLKAFNALILSSVPCGFGFASSAALEVATFAFLDALISTEKKNHEEELLKNLLCQIEDHNFAEVSYDVMEKLISAYAYKDHVTFIDSRNLQLIHVPFSSSDKAFLIMTSKNDSSSKVKCDKNGFGECDMRNAQCKKAADIMGLKNLRDAHIADIEGAKKKMCQCCYKRAKHVILENLKCQTAEEVLSKNNYMIFGELMTMSHRSLRENCELSSVQLDHLVDLTTRIQGVYGSKMNGSGFGECTVTLLERSAVNDVVRKVKIGFDRNPKFYLCTPSDGAGKIDLKKLLNSSA